MKLSVDAIVECLTEWILDANIAQEDQFAFSGLRVLTGEERELEDGILYVCASKVLYSMKKDVLDKGCFVIKTCPFEYQPINAIILKDSSNLRDVTNKLLRDFDEVNNYERMIKDAATSRDGFNPFFEIAEKMLPNCLIVMTDSAYSIVARTRDSVEGNTYINDILKRGFYDKRDLDLMASHGYFEDERKYALPILYDGNSTISKVPFLVRSYRNNGATLSFIGCYFLEGKPTSISMILFRSLTDEIEKYKRSNGQYDNNLPARQQLIDDLIKEKNPNQDFCYDRCIKLKLPYRGDFRIGLIRPSINTEVKAAQMMNQLRAYCSVRNYGVFLHDSSVIILFRDFRSYDIKEQSLFDENWQALMKTLESNDAHMGISSSFTVMDKFGIAFKQAYSAAHCGCKQNPGKNVYFYSKYYINDMIEKYSEIMPLEDMYTNCLDKLDDGKNSNFSNLTLLYVYLSSERNIAMTARRVHMHRNGALYRLQKIQDILGLNLDSPEVRLRLMISFKIIEMIRKIEFDIPGEEDEEETLIQMIE